MKVVLIREISRKQKRQRKTCHVQNGLFVGGANSSLVTYSKNVSVADMCVVYVLYTDKNMMLLTLLLEGS